MNLGKTDRLRRSAQFLRTDFDKRLLVIVGVGLILAAPCLLKGFPLYADDSVQHAIYYTQFSKQLWAGDLYPRWLQGMNRGFGSPAFYFYPPIAYYLTSPLRLLFNDSQAWIQLGISAAVAICASGVSAYVWLKQSFDRRSALVAAICYMALPYHLNVDLYTRAAFAELWTFVWMPLVLCAVDCLIAKRLAGAAGLAVSYALLIMTHLPTTLIFSLVPIAYAFYHAPPRRRIRVVGLTLGAMLLGLGLSAVYLFPALAMQRFAFISDLTAGHFYYEKWFLFTKLKWSGERSELFRIALNVSGLACLAFVVSRFGSNSAIRKRATFWIAIAVGCFLMMTPLSKPVWGALSALQRVQFPWRFNAVLSLATAALIACAIASIKKFSIPVLIFLILASLLFFSWLQEARLQSRRVYPSQSAVETVAKEQNKWLEQSSDQAEFRPRWVVSTSEAELELLLQRFGQSNGLPVATMLRGVGTVAIDSWKPREIGLQVDSTDGAVINLSQFYFPGWGARLDNIQSLEVRPSLPGGLVSVTVPAGKHSVSVQLGRKAPELLGQVVSGLSLLILLVLTWYYSVRKSRPEAIGSVDRFASE